MIFLCVLDVTKILSTLSASVLEASSKSVTRTIRASQKSSLSSKDSTTLSTTPNSSASGSYSSISLTYSGTETSSASPSSGSSSTSPAYSDTDTTATTSSYNVSANSSPTPTAYSDIITPNSMGGNTGKQSSKISTMIPQLFTDTTASRITASSLKSTPTESKAKSTTETAPAQIDVCADSKVQVYEGLYIVSPGKETGSNYPVDVHCSLDITCQTDKVTVTLVKI